MLFAYRNHFGSSQFGSTFGSHICCLTITRFIVHVDVRIVAFVAFWGNSVRRLRSFRPRTQRRGVEAQLDTTNERAKISPGRYWAELRNV